MKPSTQAVLRAALKAAAIAFVPAAVLVYLFPSRHYIWVRPQVLPGYVGGGLLELATAEAIAAAAVVDVTGIPEFAPLVQTPAHAASASPQRPPRQPSSHTSSSASVARASEADGEFNNAWPAQSRSDLAKPSASGRSGANARRV